MPVHVQHNGHVATITIEGDDERNVLTPEVCLELDKRLGDFDIEPALHAAVLRGAGTRHFSVGGPTAASSFPGSAEQRAKLLRDFWFPDSSSASWALVWESLFARRTKKPVVAAVLGDCLGTALVVVGLHTDIRIAGRGARFGLPISETGAGASTVSRLASQISRATLLWLVQTGQRLSADAACDRFLVNEVVPDDTVFARANAVAQLVAAQPASALRAEKRALIERASY